MKKLLKILLIILPFAVFAQENTYVLMISFDGFRYDYVKNYDTPNFKKFIEKGVAAESLVCSYPSKTFPNHYTLVTGLYPGHHGLVDNGFYDPAREEIYSMGKRDMVEDAYYYDGKPLWQLVQEHGMKSASYFWVGSEAPIMNRYPDYYYRYDGSVPNENRIDQVMGWLNLPEPERPRFITLYFSLVDSQGHETGPESEETGKTVEEADRLLGLVIEGIEKIGLPVNVIVTSDHGMYPVSTNPEFVIEIPSLIDLENDEMVVVSGGTHVQLYIEKESQIDSIYQVLKKKEDHFIVYKKDETPEKWHYREHPRIGNIIMVAQPGYIFSGEKSEPDPGPYRIFGVHGYDPYTTPEMGGIFYAQGPNIQEGITIEAFENVHVYPFIGMLLGIKAKTKDSDPEVLKKILR